MAPKYNIEKESDSYKIFVSDKTELNNCEVELRTILEQFELKVKWAIVYDSSYYYCCVAAKNNQKGDSVLNGLGVAFASGHGDGEYPVVATYDNEGNIKKIEINF